MATNIVYFISALALAITPTIWEWIKTRRKPPTLKIMVLITVVLVIVGVVKTIKDSNDSERNSDYLSRLTNDVSKLVRDRKTDSLRNAQYADRLKAIGVTRDSIKNAPVINKNIHIHSISGSTVTF